MRSKNLIIFLTKLAGFIIVCAWLDFLGNRIGPFMISHLSILQIEADNNGALMAIDILSKAQSFYWLVVAVMFIAIFCEDIYTFIYNLITKGENTDEQA